MRPVNAGFRPTVSDASGRERRERNASPAWTRIHGIPAAHLDQALTTSFRRLLAWSEP